ncbi:unannotated protein [freshwater metagenome]|uniref:Unannotated protein n=1 Tax=freshwater metagenome TaxID=449393 RepID=A0A6J7QE37_9ZZZZ
MGQFGYISAHVFAARIKFLALEYGVEDPVERGGIGTAPSGPLPAVRVARKVAIAEPIHEFGGTTLPRDM